MATRVASRRIAALTPSEVATLAAEGRDPALPADVVEERAVDAQSVPIREIAKTSWLGSFEGDKLVALLGFFVRFDHHRLCQVREVIHVAGSPRGVRELLLELRATSALPLVGCIAITNKRMAYAIGKLGWRPRRIEFELEPSA